jgi:hypothetical protein
MKKLRVETDPEEISRHEFLRAVRCLRTRDIALCGVRA